MVIAGLKLTHDGAVAVIEDGRLVFSTEVEKLGGNPRYAPLDDLSAVVDILAREGLTPSQVDRWVVDGWHAERPDGPAFVPVRANGRTQALQVSPYVSRGPNPLRSEPLSGLSIGSASYPYLSFSHATGHVVAAYVTSPFAARGEPAHVLVWDGGMLPQLYRVSSHPARVMALGALFPIVGNAFSDFSAHFGPFREALRRHDAEGVLMRTLEVAGKAMAYAALGDEEAIGADVFTRALDEIGTIDIRTSTELAQRLLEWRSADRMSFTDADAVASFQAYLGGLLVTSLERAIGTASPANLCLSGGCALNIKWNSAIRARGFAAEVWVPPFANDAGSAIGAAAAEWLSLDGASALDWDVYAGPALDHEGERPPGGRPCSTRDFGRWLHETGAPAIILTGRAELGPRALGHRSILAPATDPTMKERLNELKGRETFRPVAPIAMESGAAAVFSPGSADPYMLFEHTVRSEWRQRVPAIVHLDGSARLQTISDDQPGPVAEVLSSYASSSGIPLLCNTSANENGRGFFPSVAAALRWSEGLPVWSDGVLYSP